MSLLWYFIEINICFIKLKKEELSKCRNERKSTKSHIAMQIMIILKMKCIGLRKKKKNLATPFEYFWEYPE